MAVNLLNSVPAVVKNPSIADLKRIVKESGLLELRPRYYAFKIPLTVALPVPGIFVLVLVDNLWIQLLNALYLAFAFTQIVFVGHDCGHRQVFSSPPGMTHWLCVACLWLVSAILGGAMFITGTTVSPTRWDHFR